MQEAVIEQLLDIYANTKNDEVSTNPVYCQLYDMHNSSLWFTENQSKIEEAKHWIEGRVAIQESIKNQLRECLKLLKKRKVSLDNKGYDFALRLIQRMYYASWSVEQKIHFDKVCCILDNWDKQYFLSFTGRKLNPNEINQLHKNHEHFIRDVLGYRKSDWLKDIKSDENLLAKAINALLSQRLTGFYYPYHEGDNSVVEQKLRSECNCTFSFVQLVQNIMFHPHTDRENYCHCEYCYIREAEIPDECRLYILAEECHEDLMEIEDVYHEYEEWLTEIHSKTKVELDFTRRHRSTIIESQRKKIENNIIKKIEIERKQLFENVPD